MSTTRHKDFLTLNTKNALIGEAVLYTEGEMKMKKEDDNQTEVKFPVAGSFEALAEVALENLNGERGLHMVCGPITTGGVGDASYNLDILIAVVCGLKKEGKRVFDQTPYEQGLHYLAEKWKHENGDSSYCLPILHVFYNTLFEREVVSEAWFIPGWQSSVGTRWEYRTLTQKKCLVHELKKAEVEEYLFLAYTEEKARLLADSLFAS